MKKLFLVTVLVVGTLTLAGCSQRDSSSSDTTQSENKQGDTTVTGTITESGGTYFLQQTGGIPEAIDSYSVDLDAYVGQTVTVTGQYSGQTLFVGSIE